jgi:hypothetical protein
LRFHARFEKVQFQRESYDRRGRNVAGSSNEKIREIYRILPKLNCGLCGHNNCGQFALAAAKGRESPFGCQQDPSVGYRIRGILGQRLEASSYKYRFDRPLIAQKPGSRPSLGLLKKEVRELQNTIDKVLERIDRLEAVSKP